MYITGIGRTHFGNQRDSLGELARTATLNALTDASMEMRDIDAIYVSNYGAGLLQQQLHLNALMADTLEVWGLPIIRIETACASGGSAMHQAILALKTYKNILVVGMEKLSESIRKTTESLSMASDRQKDTLNGLIFPAAYALIASQYMRRYDLTLHDLAEVSYKNHAHANMNKYAQFYTKKITIDSIMNSPIVSSPLRLYDCSPIGDGGCAIILSRKKRNNRDIKVLASSLSTGSLSLTGAEDITTFPAAVKSAKNAYQQAGMSPKEMDIICIHDCFTIAEIIAMEDLGLCLRGKAKDMIRKKKTWFTSEMPVNTHGGLKADGHPIGASGLAQIFELVIQLRGEAGIRQVSRARRGLAHNVGGVGGTVTVHILSKK